VALVVLAPRLRRAIGGRRAWTGEDIGELVVAAAAGIDDQTARIVVAPRALGVPMEAVAAAEGLATGTAHKRRQRAEQRIRASVQSGAAPLPIP
jgi:DNA-directed RNA polymerase specialized sigma24 family protein